MTVVNCDDLEHRVVFLLGYDFVSRESHFCCTPEFPCPEHKRQLGWLLETRCGLEMSISGHAKEGNVTCLSCLANG